MVLLEAMVAGMAIITTKDTGSAEVVGDSALLINSKSPEAIREALKRLINDRELLRSLQAASRKRVEELFGWEQVARQYMNVYKNYPELDEKIVLSNHAY